jgi:3-oxoacyl-[acyl-carrier protein] reductase
LPNPPEAPVTLITGTSRGLGRALARHYLEKGHRVVGCSRASVDWSYPGYTHHEVDVADAANVRDLFAGVRKNFGRLDHLINNAGIAAMNHFLTTPDSTVERLLRTNVAGTFSCCREGAKLMRKRRFGRIVNLTSVAVPLRLEGESVYVASKAAVESLTAVLARELAPLGITVNAVGPMPIETDLIRGVPVEKIDSLVARQAIPERGCPADVANVTDFLLSAASGRVTGQTIYLGGP